MPPARRPTICWDGGTDTVGEGSIVGGQGNDTMVVGTGTETLAGGTTSADWFIFIQANGGVSAQDTISNFTANDTVFLDGYGSAAAAAALAGATSNGAGTTITLSDNTTITFASVASASDLTGHVVSL